MRQARWKVGDRNSYEAGDVRFATPDIRLKQDHTYATAHDHTYVVRKKQDCIYARSMKHDQQEQSGQSRRDGFTHSRTATGHTSP